MLLFNVHSATNSCNFRAYCIGSEVNLVEYIVHSVEVRNRGGYWHTFTECICRGGYKELNKRPSVLTNEVRESKLSLCK